MTVFRDSALWDFAVALYGKDGVAPACLSLQARRAIDVNLLLFAVWCGASGRGALDRAALADAIRSVAPWHGEVVRGLRAVRDRLKGTGLDAPDDLAARIRRQVLAVELDAEHIETLILETLAPPPMDATRSPESGLAAAAANARAYLSTRGRAPDDADMRDLGTILGAAFPGFDAASVERALR